MKQLPFRVSGTKAKIQIFCWLLGSLYLVCVCCRWECQICSLLHLSWQYGPKHINRESKILKRLRCVLAVVSSQNKGVWSCWYLTKRRRIQAFRFLVNPVLFNSCKTWTLPENLGYCLRTLVWSPLVPEHFTGSWIAIGWILYPTNDYTQKLRCILLLIWFRNVSSGCSVMLTYIYSYFWMWVQNIVVIKKNCKFVVRKSKNKNGLTTRENQKRVSSGSIQWLYLHVYTALNPGQKLISFWDPFHTSVPLNSLMNEDTFQMLHFLVWCYFLSLPALVSLFFPCFLPWCLPLLPHKIKER